MSDVKFGGAGDIEFGCEIYSKTLQDHRGYPVGGVVVTFGQTGDRHWFGVLRFTGERYEPHIYEIDSDDIDPQTIKWYTAEPRKVANMLFAWLGRQPKRCTSTEQSERVVFADIAARLTVTTSNGNLLPKANERFMEKWRAERAERDAAKAAELVEPSDQHVEDLKAQIADVVNDSRARRGA